MAASLADWYDELAVHAPGATVLGMEQAMQGAVKQFLRESGAYVKDLSGISIVSGRATYTIPTQKEGPILFIQALYYKQRPICPLTAEPWLRLASATAISPDVFRGYVDEPGKFTLWPTPSAAYEERVYPYVSIGYDPDCTEGLPSILMSQWYDVILSGAISRLAMQQNKPYTDAMVAKVHGAKFRAGMATARDMARKQFVKQETEFRFPSWA